MQFFRRALGRNLLGLTSAIILLSSSPALAQQLRWGIIGGTAWTEDYPAFATPGYTVSLPDGTPLSIPGTVSLPAGRQFYGGAAIEWQPHRLFSLEGNAIYRRLRFSTGGPTVTWQFPILAKYRVPVGPTRLFVAGGPSFRTTGNRNTNPSHMGITAGAGVEWDWGAWRLSPTLRYTRWARDPTWTTPSKPDQVEILLGFTRGASSIRKPFGRQIRFGVVGGVGLNHITRAFDVTHEGQSQVGNFYRIEPKRTAIVGSHFEYAFSDRWSLLAEATYRQIRTRHIRDFTFEPPSGEPIRVQLDEVLVPAILWQFPVLVKRRFKAGRLHPFLEAGPSFRLPQDYNGDLSTVGITGGAGVGFTWKAMRIEPGLRFSHWGAATDRLGRVEPNHTRRNQLDAVAAITF